MHHDLIHAKPRSLIGKRQRTPELESLPPMSCSLCRDEQLYVEHMWQMWKRLEMSWQTLCCLQNYPAWPVWQWISDHVGHTDLEILAISTGMKPSDLILVQWALHSSWCRTTPRLMLSGFVSTTWIMRTLMPLTGPHIPHTWIQLWTAEMLMYGSELWKIQ